MVNERTPLRKGANANPPPYVFMTNPNRVYRKQVRQFQCCICTAILATFICALVITITYSVDHDVIDNPPEPPTDNTSLNILLSTPFPLQDSRLSAWNLASISVEDLTSAIAEGKASLDARDKMEATNPGISTSSPSYRHQQSVKTSARATNLARSAYVMDVATKAIVRKQKSSGKKPKPIGRGPILNNDWLPKEECGTGPVPACPPSAYRTVDGSCNNPYKPNQWGVAMRPFRRQLPADYGDGVSSPRIASDGSSLPPARDVSTTVHRPTYRDDPKFTVMLAVWGQFLDHDITATALTIGAGGKALSCCGATATHPECYPVTLSENDAYYKQYGVTCMEFIRSAPAPTCALGPREQMNQVSSYIDGSAVYGNTPELSRALRTYQGGKLKMSLSPDGRELLPISTNPKDGCNREEESAKGRYCFMAGDVRANENLHLTSLHLLMARQHNILSQKLSELNPEWNDEQVYQESRKIVSAQMQHITYNEFLPVLLGPDLMDKLELNPKKSGYYSGYNASIDPTISNSFATSSFRFAHTLLPGLMKVLASDTSSEEFVELHKMLFNPYSLYKPGYLDMALRGAINTKVERADTYFNKEVTQRLFERSDEESKPAAPKYGLDLVSLNVQRGRDHGLASYPVWRQYCGLSKPETFDDLDGLVDEGSLVKMKAVYKSVNDVDMYTGALSEIPIEGGMLGPTVTCLISDQFKRTKDGDSFWYETPLKPQGFTLGQLNEIRKTSLARVICDTSDSVTTAQPNVMESVRPGNERMPCSELPEMDLTKWTSISSKKSLSAYTKIGAIITSGNIVANNGVPIWNGAFPVAISLPLFESDSKKLPLSPAGFISYGSGIQWTGSMSIANGGILIKGSFSMPKYKHSIPGVTNFSVSWINGEFNFNSMLLWNNSDIDSVVPGGSYSSPVFLSEENDSPQQSSNEGFITVGEGDDTPTVLGSVKLPIILKGAYSVDRKTFYWSGGVTVKLPNSVDIDAADIEKLSASLPVVEIDGKGIMSGGFSVIEGSIKTSNSDGSSSVLWSGELPFEISLPEFYNVAYTTDDVGKSPVFANGVIWSASVTESMLEGDFSFPQFYNGFSNFSIKWTQGMFTFNVLPIWNTTLDEILTPGIKYTSRIIFHEDKTTLMKTVNSQLDGKYNSGPLEKFVVASQDVIDGTIPVPIILCGTFSSVKNTFSWSGDVIIAVRKSKTKIDQQMAKLKSSEIDMGWSASRFGGIVETGYLTAGLNNENPKSIWTGNIPVSIPIPEFYSPVSFLFTPGVTWSGSLLGSTLHGTYNIQQVMWNNLIPTVQTWSGEFSIQINPLWNTSLDSVFVPGVKYYSKLNFQGVGDLTYIPMDIIDKPDLSSDLYAPIILQGTYSLDKKTFLWSGNFIISFRNGISLYYTAPSPQTIKPPINNLANGDKNTSLSLTISSGSVFASLTGETEKQIWSGIFPTTIPLDPITPSNNYGKMPVANVIWSGKVTKDIVNGIFSVPTYVDGESNMQQWWSGNFSFKYTTKYPALLNEILSSGKKYNFKVLFRHVASLYSSLEEKKSKLQSVVNLAMDAQDILDDVPTGKLVLVGDFYSKPFYCYISPFCSNKNEFYWSGDIFIGLDPNKVIQLAINNNVIDFVPQYSQQFGGQVMSGSLKAGLENSSPSVWWSGVLPVTIPVTGFYSPGETPDSGTSINHGITWTGSSFGSTVTGTFSLPQYVWNGISKSIQWWNGQFNFQVQPLWNVTLDGLISPGVKYYSAIHFQGMKEPITESKMIIKGSSFGDDGISPLISAPVILQGTYTPDGSAFIWNGNFIISFKNSPAVFSTLNNAPKQLENLKKSDNSTKNPSKPSKPPKLSVSFSLTNGNVFASSENKTGMYTWSGKIPVRINLDLLAKPGGYSVSADVTWKSEQLTPALSGQFSIPTYIKNDSLVIIEMWYGNFSINTETKYGTKFDVAVKLGNTYSCKIFFKSQTKLVTSLGYKTSTQYASADSNNLGEGEACNIILLGSFVSPPIYCKLLPFLCTESNLFDWNGQGFLSFPLPKPPSVNMTEKFLQSNSLNKGDELRKEIFATVLSGHLVGSLESDYPRILWSGSLPAEIPLPVFWTTDSIDVPVNPQVYGHGVIWSGTQMGTFFEGYFSLPQYAFNGIVSSVQWWNGRFSFLLEPSPNSTLDGLIMPGIKYNSRIIFQDSNHMKKLLTSPSQDEINSALHVPIVLQGSYSPDRKIFYWSGKVTIVFHAIPSPFYFKQFATNRLNSIQENKLEGTKVVGVKKSVGIVVTSVNISRITNESTIFSLPVVIPLQNLSNKTTGSKIVMVDWVATSVTDSQVVGEFTLPTYIPFGENFTVDPFSASFSLNFTTLFNTSIDAIQPGIQYSSIVIFQSSKKMEYDNLKLSSTDEKSTGNKSSIIMLSGSISPDKMSFIWTGQAWLNFPSNTSESKKLTFKLGEMNKFKASGGAGVKKSIGVVVTSGNVSGTTDGTVSNWWSGSLPAVIPLQYLSNKTTGSSMVKVDWVATSVTGSHVEGNFTFPTFIPTSENFIVEPLSGIFSLNLITLFNTSIVTIQPGIQYSSIVIFQSSKKMEYDNLKLSSTDEKSTGNKLSIIMLSGSISPDKMSFIWTGQAWLNFPSNTSESKKLTFKLGEMNKFKASRVAGVKKSIGVVVTSGNISGTTDGTVSNWWSGSLPAVIPLQHLSNKTTGSSMVKVDWVATSVTGSHVEGNFTFPTFIPTSENFIVEPLSGIFSLNLITLFNTSIVTIQPGIQYSSIVIFKSSMNSAKLQSLVATTGSISNIIILTGSISPDKLSFTWTGQAWLNFLTALTENNKETSIGNFGLSASGKGVKNSVGVMVSSGNIDVNSTPWFSGTTPVIIPVHLLSTKPSANEIVNLEWTVAEVSPHLTGNFTFPKSLSDNSNYSTEWVNGKFTFEVTPLWATSLDVIQPGMKYSTWLLFKDKSKPTPVPNQDSLTQLIMDSEENDGSQLGTISLTGTFSPDGMLFNWTGEAWLNLKMNSSYTTKTKDILSKVNTGLGEHSKFGAAAITGKIIGNSFEGPQTYWSGVLPAAIPVSLFYPSYTTQLGVLWSASGSDSLLKGTFYFPKSASKDVVWLTGNFEFQLRPLWNCSLINMIQPGIKYYSKIHFQGSTTKSRNEETGEDFNKAHNTSITLQGTFSDKDTFLWSGNFILDVFTYMSDNEV